MSSTWSHSAPRSSGPRERRGSQPLEPLVGMLAALLDQPVGVEEQRRAGSSSAFAVSYGGRSSAPSGDAAAAPRYAPSPPGRRRAAAGGPRRRSRRSRRPDRSPRAAPSPCRPTPSRVVAVQPLEQDRRVALDQRVRAHGAAQLAHRRRGADAAAGHVAHDQQQPAALQRDRVVPVAADLGPRAAGQVARGRCSPGAPAAPPAAATAAGRARSGARARTAACAGSPAPRARRPATGSSRRRG